MTNDKDRLFTVVVIGAIGIKIAEVLMQFLTGASPYFVMEFWLASVTVFFSLGLVIGAGIVLWGIITWRDLPDWSVIVVPSLALLMKEMTNVARGLLPSVQAADLVFSVMVGMPIGLAVYWHFIVRG